MSFILISDATKITGLDRQTIRNWMDRGIIPYQKINGTFYCDRDTFEALAEQMKDVDAARKNLEEERERYISEKEAYRRMKEDVCFEKNVNRWLSICINSGVRKGFFKSVLTMMETLGIINQKECNVLTDVINGENYTDIGDKYHFSRERVRQIAEKAIWKTNDVAKVVDVIEKIDDYEKEIDELNGEVLALRKMLMNSVERVSFDNLTDVEKKLVRMDRNDLKRLFSTKITDCDLSCRCISTLLAYRDNGFHKPIKTIGELCMISKNDYLNQRNAGKKTLNELTSFLENKGLSWEIDVDKVLKIVM